MRTRGASMDASAEPDPLRGLLGALHLASPALPVGGFAYSQGLERAVEDRIVVDEATAARWIGDLLEHVLARTEAPLWLRAWEAASAGDAGRFGAIDLELLAIRETAELRAETRQMAIALVRLLPVLGVDSPLPEPKSYPAAYAAACAALGIEASAGLTAYLWAWLENQVLAAVKSVPLGQLAGQRLLAAGKPVLLRAVRRAAAAATTDAPPAAAGIGFSIACAAHEVQYSRLFRS